MILIRTLRILNDLSIGYTSVRKLVQLDEIQFLLHNHTVRFPPLYSNDNLTNLFPRRPNTFPS